MKVSTSYIKFDFAEKFCYFTIKEWFLRKYYIVSLKLDIEFMEREMNLISDQDRQKGFLQ